MFYPQINNVHGYTTHVEGEESQFIENYYPQSPYLQPFHYPTVVPFRSPKASQKQTYLDTYHFTHQHHNLHSRRMSSASIPDLSLASPMEQGSERDNSALFLQCCRMGCASTFTSELEWRQHYSPCLNRDTNMRSLESEAQKFWLQCPFLPCGRLFASIGSLKQHFDQMHLIYACGNSECGIAFEQKDVAVAHANSKHVANEAIEVVQLLSATEKSWTLQELQNGRSFNRKACLSYEGIFNFEQMTEEPAVPISPNRGVSEVASPMARTVSSASSINYPITPLSEYMTRRSSGANSPVHFDNSQYPMIPILQTQNLHVPSYFNLSPNLSPHSRIQPNTGRRHSYSGVQVPPTVAVPYVSRSISQRSREPPVRVSLSLEEQKPYLSALLNVCVSASYAFYTAHNLFRAVDKKGIPIFLTKDKTHIRLPHDVTLPQWTQQLRKACDTKHVNESMVDCLESFKGEIQPVDEVRHAVVKAKLKSDRALLALIETARTYTKQLRDWDRCEMVDTIYDEVENLILRKKHAILIAESSAKQELENLTSTPSTEKELETNQNINKPVLFRRSTN